MVGEESETAPSEEAEALNLSDPVQVQARNKKAKARAELRRRFIVQLLSTREGREWMYEMLSAAGVYRMSYAPGADALSMAFREGQRNIGNMLLTDVISASPEGYAAMQNEAAENG